MKNEKKKELLSTIYNSIVGMEDGFKYEETKSEKYEINGDRSEISKNTKIIKNYDFDISNSKMSLRFCIRISKIPDTSFFGKDKTKYITHIRVYDKSSPYSAFREDFCVLSWIDDTLDIQKKIFEIIENKIFEIKVKKEDEKYNKYITELYKSVDKVSSRDNKIDDIIS